MARNVTPNQNGDLEFQERVIDQDGDTITLDSVELDEIDGTPQTGGDRDPSWLSWSATDNTLQSGTTEKLVNIDVEAASLNVNVTYTFKLVANDGTTTTPRFVDLQVVQPSLIPSPSGNVFAMGAEGTNPRAITFRPDGSKMYILGTGSDSVHEYTLSTPGDITTASYTGNSLSVQSEDDTPIGLVISNNGSKLFMSGALGDKIFEYDLSSAFDLSTASYSGNALDISNEAASHRGFAVDGTGNKFYISDDNSDTIYQYDLTTSFDVTSGSYSGKSLDVSSESTIPRGISFNNGGEVLILAGGNEVLYEYNLSTPYDISTASYSGNSLDISVPVPQVHGIVWNDAGTRLHVAETQNDEIVELTY